MTHYLFKVTTSGFPSKSEDGTDIRYVVVSAESVADALKNGAEYMQKRFVYSSTGANAPYSKISSIDLVGEVDMV